MVHDLHAHAIALREIRVAVIENTQINLPQKDVSLMSQSRIDSASPVSTGIAAGLAGSCVMMMARAFDEKYAPRTVAETKAATGISLGFGSLLGLLYGLGKKSAGTGSTLGDGIVLGMVLYSIGFGILPAMGLSKPPWKQEFPKIAGGLLRHAIYGVATAASFDVINAAMSLIVPLSPSSPGFRSHWRLPAR
jgi:hypothetical protein